LKEEEEEESTVVKHNGFSSTDVEDRHSNKTITIVNMQVSIGWCVEWSASAK